MVVATVKPPYVFINFRGAELRKRFVGHLCKALSRQGINTYIDSDEKLGTDLTILFDRIEGSRVALAVLSSEYTESDWCLDELVKIKECVDRRTLWAIPIFFNIKPSMVKSLNGAFGDKLWKTWKEEGRGDRILKWDAALQDVAGKSGLELGNRDESEFVEEVATHVKNILEPEEDSNQAQNSIQPGGQRLKQLEEKLDMECNDNKTRFVGIVGMAGIGKTYLAEILFEKLKIKIGSHVLIKFGSETSKEQDLCTLQKKLVEGLLKKTINTGLKNPLEFWKRTLIKNKVAVVFDNVTDPKQIDMLLGNCDWIKNGSKMVITTRDKSLLKTLNCNLYEVPKLNDRESLGLFKAQICRTLNGNFKELSRKFMDYAGGNPLALEEFGRELDGKEMNYWETRLGTLTQCSNPMIKEKLKICYDALNDQQKDVFLDIAYFFRSEDENYVTCLLDSFDHGSAEAGKKLESLADKFLIGVCDDRVEMHDLLLTMANELVEATDGKYMLLSSKTKEFSRALQNEEGKEKVRGIVLDMSEMKEMPLDNQPFVGMSSLLYLKVYDPGHSEAGCKLNLADGVKFSKDNILRYLHWMKFSGKELSSDFEPTNLIDLRLPYSKITCLWKCAKVAPNLRWVDLSHSRKLSSLSGLSEAPNLLRLNLEGCTSLKELPQEMQKMKNLVFLNLRGCTSLLSLPKITMDSLKTLILSGCSELQTFEVISEQLETLYLNSTKINELPPAIGNLQKLIFLNLKDCKKLAILPDCLGKLKSIKELKLSRCSKLKSFPDVKEIKENLRVLLLDKTLIAKMPGSISDLSLLRRLCLNKNDNILSLEFDMGQMFHLKWLEFKYCKNLTSLPKLPPNLQCLNAHGCTSLRIVASPLALLMPIEQIHSTFNFTNCHELEHVSKSSIISYVQKKSELTSDDRYNQDSVFNSLIGTCFPGCDVPAWFNHQAFGCVLKLGFPQGWNESRLNGLALCVVVSFKDYKDQNNGLQVKCTCEITNVFLSRESFIIGGWSEPGDEPQTIESDHVFIGYTTLFNIKKRQHFSSATEVLLSFEVTNGASEVVECKVIKCGFTLVYEIDETEKTSCELIPRMENGNSQL